MSSSSSILPGKTRNIKLIGVQEINHFRFTYRGRQYEVVLFPDSHATSNFNCGDEHQQCDEVNSQIKEQIDFAQSLHLNPLQNPPDMKEDLEAYEKENQQLQ